MQKEDIIPLVREFPDRSIRWLLETPENVRGLLLAISVDIAKQIDYTRLQKLDKTFIPDDFRKREADMVFLVPFSDESGKLIREVMIYILIENQSTVDPTMSFRMLYYMVQIWEMQRRELENQKVPLAQWRFRPILPVIFYTGSKGWDFPLDMKNLVELPISLERFVPKHDVLFFNLKETLPEKLTIVDHPFGWILRVIQKEKASTEEFGESLRIAVKHLEQMSPEEIGNWEKLIRFLIALVYHRRGQTEREEFIGLIESNVVGKSRKDEVKRMGKTIAQTLIEEGMELGIVITKQEDIIKLLYSRFESFPQTFVEKIRSINTIKQLNTLFDFVLKAKNIDEVEIALSKILDES